MKRYSPKRSKLNEVADEWRRQRLCDLDKCDLCQGQATELHEIARGPNRLRFLMEPCGQLATCRACHEVLDGMSMAKQLAWLRFRRPEDFNLEWFWVLSNRNFPSYEDVFREFHLLEIGAK